MKTKLKKRNGQARWSSGRLVRRLMKLVTEDGKFAYGTPTRCLDVVEHVFASHRRMCNNLQTLVQKHNLGDAGMPVDEIVCAELAKYLRFPPPVDNAFVAPGCEKFGKAKKRAPFGLWQPIETAPYDETEVLIKTDIGIVSAWFHSEPGESYQWVCYDDAFTIDGDDGRVTHWMPLPTWPNVKDQPREL